MATRNRTLLSLRLRARRVHRWLGWCGKTAADLLFPPRCAYCDHDLPELDDHLTLCQPCRDNLGPDQRAGCRRCGATMAYESPAVDGCDLCRSVQLHFKTVVPLAGYRGDVRTVILRMKHASGEPLSRAMGDLLLLRRRDQLAGLQADVVVPVPMYWARRFRRGTNSPEILARRLALQLGVSLETGLLVRCRNTLLQPELPPRERFRNIRGAFRVTKGYDLRGARVLLVDDVLTTGATCSEAAKMLKQAGANWVAVAVVARAEKDK